ncbi:MFS transporter [Bacillus norwichensis]|uniref:MFS transporter n=1 Tax=Bacillus norwichensis TaxID=2762217 RepID=A0ABR8VS73_9BACI|nr:MFS transporter [Bacillus norwichensis]MBD8007605.1 MFS transporter [Bacillus norwichensis]
MGKEKRTTKGKLWTKSFILLVLANLFVFMSFQMLIPTVSPYLKSLGASGIEIGLVTMVFSVGAVIIRPFIGYLLGFCQRRWLILVGAAGLLAVTILYPLTQIIFVLLIFRFLHGFMWGWSSTVNGTAAVDIVPNDRIGEGMGYFGLSITVGMIIAPSIGIFLYQHYSFDTMIKISAVFGVIALLLLSVIKYQTPENVKNMNKKDVHFSFTGSLIESSSWFPAFVTLLATFGYGTIVTFIVIFSEERGIEQIFLFYFLNAITATLVRPITGKWFDRNGPKLLVIVCSGLTFISMWILSFSTNWVGIAISGCLFGAGYGSLIPALQAWVLAKTPKARRGVANGMFYSAIDVGIGMSGLVFGMVAIFMDTAKLFQISSFFFIAVIAFTLFVGEKTVYQSTGRMKRDVDI